MSKKGAGWGWEGLGPLFLRVPLGLVFVAHGSQKLFGIFGGQGITATLKSFEENLGIPPLFTILAMLAEFGGGMGVLTGTLTRLSSSGIAAVMGVAIYKVSWANGFFMNWQNLPGKGHGYECHLVMLGMALSLVCTGGGRWSLDRLLWRR